MVTIPDQMNRRIGQSKNIMLLAVLSIGKCTKINLTCISNHKDSMTQHKHKNKTLAWSPGTTSGLKTEQAYSYNPGPHAG